MIKYPIISATLTLTHACNLRCAHCFTWGKNAEKMTFETGKACMDFIFKNAAEANINVLNGKRRAVEVAFWGGEPLLEWELMKKLVEYGYDSPYKDVAVHFGGTTNGMLFTPEKFGFLQEYEVNLMISIDGLQITHDRTRKTVDGKGSHATIMKNLEKALRVWPPAFNLHGEPIGLRVRMSPHAETVHTFYEDVRYLIQHGMFHLMYSPVYESAWTEDKWKIWEEQCLRVVDLLMYLRRDGLNVTIEHYNAYMSRCGGRYPCGAGRFYVGFDVDGSMEPCHRFRKFNDPTPWNERPMCIGHVSEGITKPELRQKFIDWHKCDCKYSDFTPCNGGCFSTNHDITGDIFKPAPNLCRYVAMQKKVSEYFKFCQIQEYKQIGEAAKAMVQKGSTLQVQEKS